MVKKGLTCPILIQSRKMLKEQDKKMEAITNWLYKVFSVDSEQYDLSIIALDSGGVISEMHVELVCL